MNSERFHRVMAIFHKACDLDRDERSSYLKRQCGDDLEMRREVEQMLAADDQADSGASRISVGDGRRLLAAQIATSSGETARAADNTRIKIPKRLGKYEIIEKLGEGGMGVVYLGIQKNPQRRVALKVLKPNAATAGTLRRFEHEALVLGWLNHEGIAQIHEADSHESDGRSLPFIAMEYIQGKSLSRYLQESSPPTPVDERLRLFIRICEAVSYAHQQGIIHRDLKPSNVLVDESGAPKVLDFGVARLLDADLRAVTSHTSAGEVIGTLAYMSPEQVSGDTREVDTRSDVYALGVMLYETLCGRHPHDFVTQSWIDAAHIIRDQPPTPLSAANSRMRGDLETIVHKALSKDKDRRYQSVSEFSNDIEMYLANQPISARRDSGFYVLRKTIQRHRLAVGAAAAFVLFIGIAAVALGIMYRREHRASRQASIARDEEASARRQAEAVNQFLQNMLYKAHPTESETESTVRDVLSDAESMIETEIADQPRVKASVLLAIGHAQVGLGDFESAERCLTEALSISRQIHGVEHAEIASALHAMSVLRLEQGRYQEADSLCRLALVMRRKVLGNEDDAVIESMALLARIQSERGLHNEAEALYRDVLAVCRALDHDRGRRVATTMNDLAVCLERSGKSKEAEAMLREALTLHREQLGGRHLEVAVCLGNLGAWQQAMNRPDKAEKNYRDALSIYRERVGDKHPSTIRAMSNLSGALRDLGQLDEARALIDEVLRLQREHLGDRHPDFAVSLNNLSQLLVSSGDLRGAVAPARESLEVLRATYGEKHAQVGKAMLNLGRILEMLGEHAEAEELLGEAIGIMHGALSDSDPSMATALHNYAIRQVRIRELVSAETAMRSALAIAQQNFDEEHPFVAQIRNGLGLVLFKKEHFDGAESQFRLSLRVLEALPLPHRAAAAETMDNLAGIHERRREFEEAESLLKRSLALRRETLPERHPGIALSQLQLGRLYMNRNSEGDTDRALIALQACHAIRTESLPPSHWQVVEAVDLLGAAMIRLRRFDDAKRLLTAGYDRLVREAHAETDLKQLLARRIVEVFESSGDSESAKQWQIRLDGIAPGSPDPG